MRPSGVLIDKIVDSDLNLNKINIDGKFYISRPKIKGKKWKIYGNILRKLRACFRVLSDRGLVVYYKEDE